MVTRAGRSRSAHVDPALGIDRETLRRPEPLAAVPDRPDPEKLAMGESMDAAYDRPGWAGLGRIGGGSRIGNGQLTRDLLAHRSEPPGCVEPRSRPVSARKARPSSASPPPTL